MTSFIKTKITNLSRTRKGLFLFLLALFLFLLPLISEAAIGTGIFDYFTAKLAGISEMVHPFTFFFVFLVSGLLISGAALHATVWLLTIASDPANLAIAESQAVQIGWQFTSSLANTMIIVFLIIIGIATILNQESYSAKKTLPKLIIAALLVNFSLVFVGAVVDISNIVLNTFFDAEAASKLTETIFATWENNLGAMLTYLGGLMISFVIPFIAPFAQFAFVIAMSTAFLPTVVSSLMQIFTGFLIAGILFIYAFLFFARIFVIQILAILSPLAFIAWVLPSTKKFWDQWLKALVGWAMLGVILFFFLLLSTIITEPLRPEPGFASLFTSRANIQTVFIYYITLAIFLVISSYIGKKFMPTGADIAINGVKNAATGFRDNPITQSITKRVKGRMASGSTAEAIREKDARVEANRERLEQRKQELKSTSGVKKIGVGFKTAFDWGRAQGSKASSTVAKASRVASIYTGKAPEQTVEEAKSYNKEMWLKGKTDEELRGFLKQKNVPDYRKDQILEHLISEGALTTEEMKDDLQKDIPTERKEQLIKALLAKGQKYEGPIKEEAENLLQQTLPNDKRRKQNLIQELVDKGAKIEDNLRDQIVQRWDDLEKKTRKEVLKKHPDIHIDFAKIKGETEEDGIKKMIDEINKMQPKDTREIKLDEIKPSYRVMAASTLARNSSVVKSWGGASYRQKQLLIDSLDGADDETMQRFSNNVSKNADQWTGFYEEVEEEPEITADQRKEDLEKRISDLRRELLLTTDKNKAQKIQDSIDQLEKELRENY